jgi:hypothetical protein
MEEVVICVVVLIIVEVLWRWLYCSADALFYDSRRKFLPLKYFLTAYLSCILPVLLNFKNIHFFQSRSVRLLIRFLHACDGFIALLIGTAIFYENDFILCFAILLISKFFLLHLLSRMVTGVRAYSKLSIIFQTTKTFIHHTSSFYFLSYRYPSSLCLTSFWRFLSMTGHAALTLRRNHSKDDENGWWTLSDATYERTMWFITHCRNIIMVVVLFLCYWSDDIRSGLGKVPLLLFVECDFGAVCPAVVCRLFSYRTYRVYSCPYDDRL